MASNGRLDVNTLTKVPLSAGGFGYLENATARGWLAAREDLMRTTGTIPVIINDGLYRDYARQVYWETYWTRLGKPQNAATPGTSNHGLGLCVDINNISAYNQKTLDTVMARHGFVRDTTETWHYHHTSINPADSESTEIIEEKEEDMSYSLIPGVGTVPGVIMSLVTGQRANIQNVPHLQLLQRAKKNDYNDPMLSAELDVVTTYIASVNVFGINLSAADKTSISNQILAGLPSGAFTPTDRAMLDDIANKAELSSALTNTVNLVNSHADANKAQIIQEIDTHGGSSLSAFTATITPVE